MAEDGPCQVLMGSQVDTGERHIVGLLEEGGIGGQVGKHLEGEVETVGRGVGEVKVGTHKPFRIRFPVEGHTIEAHPIEGILQTKGVADVYLEVIGVHEERRLVHVEAEQAVEVRGIVLRHVVSDAVQVHVASVVCFAHVDMVITLLIHTIDVEGMTSQAIIMGREDDGPSALQFVSKQTMPGRIGEESPLHEIDRLVVKGIVERLDGAAQACPAAMGGPVHLYGHTQVIGKVGNGLSLTFVILARDIIGEDVVPVYLRAGQDVGYGVVFRLPSVQGVLECGRMPPVAHHLFEGSGHTSRDTRFLAERTVLVTVIRTGEVVGMLLVTEA